SDPFQAHRGPKTRYIVGVMMDVFYPIATEPDTQHAASIILYDTETMIYDLELDQNMNVVGGEWHSPEHPDFIWTFPAGARALSSAEFGLGGTWDGASVLSPDWLA